MKYVPIPVALLEVGKPLPVDVLSDTGQLLLRRGQPIVSEQHRDKLHGFHASTSASDGLAWQHAYERMVHELLQKGMDARDVAKAPMPIAIRATDYVVGEQVNGGWLDLQAVLRGILYQGGLAINPLPRLKGLEEKALALLHADVDASLFELFQALGDNSLGYCATHALLCAVVCELTGAKLGLSELQRKPLIGAALTMNIGMARDQDSRCLMSPVARAIWRVTWLGVSVPQDRSGSPISTVPCLRMVATACSTAASIFRLHSATPSTCRFRMGCSTW